MKIAEKRLCLITTLYFEPVTGCIRTLAGARCQGDNSGELTASTAANSLDQSLSPNSSESSALMSIIANYTSHTSRRRHAADVCRYVHVYRKLKCNAVTVAQYAPMPLIYVQKKTVG